MAAPGGQARRGPAVLLAPGGEALSSVSTPRPPVGLIYAITVTGITVNTLVAPGIPDILDGLGAPRSLAGLIVASATFPGILLAPTVGILADRYGRREVLAPCLLLYAIGGGLVAVAPSLWVLVVLRVIQGAGSAGLINLAVVLIGDHWDGVGRSRLIGRNSAVITVGVALFPSFGGFLTDLGGWRAPFLLYPLGLVMVWFVLRLPPTRAGQARMRDQVRAAAPYLRSPRVIGLLVAGVVLFVLIFGLLLTIMPLYLEERFGLGATGRGIIMGLPAVGATVVALSLGRLRGRFARLGLLVTGSVLLAVALAGMSRAPVLLFLGLAMLVFGLGEGLMIPNLQDVAVDAAPASSRGTVVATWVGSARLGQTLGPLLAGVSLTAVGAGPSFALGAVVALGLAVLLLAGARRSRQAGDRPPGANL